MPVGAGDAIVVIGSGNCSIADLVDQDDLGADHEVSIYCRDDAVIEFNEIND